MTDTLMVRDDRQVVVSSEQMDLIKKTIAPDATAAELQLFIYDNTRRGVNPLDRMIFFTKRGGKYTPVTGIDFMRTRAAETGEYAGNDDAEFEGEIGTPSFVAYVTVYRFVQGQRCPFSARARWEEYYPGDTQGHMWRKMPFTMLAKCAEALALRKGFPQQISGLYTTEEMAQAQEPPAPMPTPQSRPAPKVAAPDVIPFNDDDEPPYVAENDPVHSVYVVKLDKREGMYKTGARQGEKYAQHFIELSDGRKGSFFNGELGVSAQAALARKTPVVATFEQKGNFTNLISLIAV